MRILILLILSILIISCTNSTEVEQTESLNSIQVVSLEKNIPYVDPNNKKPDLFTMETGWKFVKYSGVFKYNVVGDDLVITVEGCGKLFASQVHIEYQDGSSLMYWLSITTYETTLYGLGKDKIKSAQLWTLEL